MADHQFNALKYVHQLKQAGVSSAQAEVQADTLAGVLDTCLSSVSDVAGMKEAVTDLKDRIDRLETRINWISGVIVAAQVGLFAMVAGLYLR
jgi:hypothetical protein